MVGNPNGLMYTFLLLATLAGMTAFMLLVFAVFLGVVLRILGGFTTPPPNTPLNPVGPSWTIKYKEDRKTQTIVLPGNDEKEVLKLVLHMGIRYDRIISMTKNI